MKIFDISTEVASRAGASSIVGRMMRSAASVSRAVDAKFVENSEASESGWFVGDETGGRLVTIGELFPSGKYDVVEVRSQEFGRQLAERVSASSLSVPLALDALSAENEARMDVNTLAVAVSKLAEDEGAANKMVCDVVPVNEIEQTIRDFVREKSRGS